MLLGLESTPSPQVQQIAQAIATAEGGLTPGTFPYRTNNPCDVFVGGSTAGYSTMDAGWQACYNQIGLIMAGRSSVPAYSAGPNSSILQIAQGWAPASAGNDPSAWASNVANALGLSPSDPLTAVGSSGTNSPAPGGYLPAQNQIDLSTGLDPSGIDNSPVSSGISLLDSSGSLTGWGWGAIAAAFGLFVLAEMG